jgi:hypothetical protein
MAVLKAMITGRVSIFYKGRVTPLNPAPIDNKVIVGQKQDNDISA